MQRSSLAEDDNTAESHAGAVDFDIYRLQLCPGKVSALDAESMTSSFRDVYEGANTSHLVTKLDPSEQYTLRVSGRSSEDMSWCPWSMPVTWLTTIPRRGTFRSLRVLLIHHPRLCCVGSRPSDHYFRSVCLFVCLFVCLPPSLK